MRTILLAEPYSEARNHLMEGIQRATQCSVTLAGNLDEALTKLIAHKGAVVGLIATITGNAEQTASKIQNIRSELRRREIRVPWIMVLPMRELPMLVAAQYRQLDISSVPRLSPAWVYAEANLLNWMNSAADDGPLLQVGFSDGHYTVTLVGLVSRQELHLSRQLRKLVMTLINQKSHRFTTEELAEAIDVTTPTIKKYLAELRKSFDAANQKVKVPQTGNQVFWTRRAIGGTLHGIKARII